MGENKNETLSMLYEFIIAHKSANDGNSPSIREMCIHLDIDSTSQVRDLIKDLQIDGKITRPKGNKARMIGVPGYSWGKDES